MIKPMRVCNRGWLFVFSTTIIAIMLTGIVQAKNNNMHFEGTLVAEPCELDPNTTDITLDFGTVIDKSLYLNSRTDSQPFIINLLECDTTLSNSAIFTFRGVESSELPGLLALTKGAASGIAIGMELRNGTQLPFNKSTPGLHLTDGATAITMKSYVEAEPSAIQNHSIGRGGFTAVATFEIEYP
ncbi:fimbrial protein [Klebsiella aerogenes]|uniref:fimbrial protein n=1 Tax=Klebsiella aerogenes TaxID=548 RepID=UPI001D02F541|nr:fimbrial protein [Klebsiella aerogenes]